MFAVVFREFGGLDKLEYARVDDPTLGPDDFLIETEACALNHQDIDLREGRSRYPIELPHITGTEGVGRIVQLPEAGSVGDFTVGQRVMIHQVNRCGSCEFCLRGEDNNCTRWQMMGVHRPGSHAELMTAPADDLLPLGDRLDATEWAAVQIAFGTAWHLTASCAQVRVGETVLINAAGSGVSSAAIQIAKLAGAFVIATAGSEAKLASARAIGADATIDYSADPIYESVMDLTNGRGVDAALDHVGGDVFTASLRAVRNGGRLATCGAHAGEVISFDLVDFFRSGKRLIASKRWTRAELASVVELVEAGRLKPVVDSVFELNDARRAQERLLARRNFGKVVMIPKGKFGNVATRQLCWVGCNGWQL